MRLAAALVFVFVFSLLGAGSVHAQPMFDPSDPPPRSKPSPAPASERVEADAYRTLLREYEKIGRHAPERDPTLDRAARTLAQGALSTRAAEAADAMRVSFAVSQAQGADYTPRALVVRASPADQALGALRARADLAEEPATVAGVGFAQDAQRGALIVLLAERKATLDLFPRAGLHPQQATNLCGTLVSPLEHPEVDVTRPSGTVERPAVKVDAEGRFCATVSVSEEGRYTLEVLGTGPRGPEVAALFFTDVGKVAATVEEGPETDPTTLPAVRATILSRVNGLRTAHAAGALTEDTALSSVAQAYSEQMAREHFFAHVSPEGQNLNTRLRARGYAFERAGENLGLAPTALAAHFGIEHSPGHRKNLMDPAFVRLGVGVAVEHVADRDQVIVTELLAVPIHASSDPLHDAYDGILERRAELQLPPLRRSAVLEAIALDQAKRALELDQPQADLPGTSVHERVFTSLPGATKTSVDLYVSQGLTHLPDSKSLKDPTNDLVGIGAVKGDSPRYGTGKYWVVVVYAGSRVRH